MPTKDKQIKLEIDDPYSSVVSLYLYDKDKITLDDKLGEVEIEIKDFPDIYSPTGHNFYKR